MVAGLEHRGLEARGSERREESTLDVLGRISVPAPISGISSTMRPIIASSFRQGQMTEAPVSRRAPRGIGRATTVPYYA